MCRNVELLLAKALSVARDQYFTLKTALELERLSLSIRDSILCQVSLPALENNITQK